MKKGQTISVAALRRAQSVQRKQARVRQDRYCVRIGSKYHDNSDRHVFVWADSSDDARAVAERRHCSAGEYAMYVLTADEVKETTRLSAAFDGWVMR